MGFFQAIVFMCVCVCVAGGGGGGKNTPQNLSHISCKNETWDNYTLTKEDPKNTHTLSSAEISIFSQEISTFCYIKKYRYRLYLIHNF